MANPHWASEQILEANNNSGFCKVNEAMNGIFYTETILMCVYSGMLLICPYLGFSIPDFIPVYTKNPVCIFCLMLLMVLYNGHDRYYAITKKTLLLSEHTFLQCIDFWTKCSLIIVSILQLINVELFIAICCYGYILTYIRALYLLKKIDKKHPLSRRVKETWYPNNVRHNCVMIVWVLLYYVILRPNVLYGILASLLSLTINFKSPEVINVLYITRQSFLIIFNFYWIQRVLKKVIIQKNKAFHATQEKQFLIEVDDYYVTENPN